MSGINNLLLELIVLIGLVAVLAITIAIIIYAIIEGMVRPIKRYIKRQKKENTKNFYSDNYPKKLIEAIVRDELKKRFIQNKGE